MACWVLLGWVAWCWVTSGAVMQDHGLATPLPSEKRHHLGSAMKLFEVHISGSSGTQFTFPVWANESAAHQADKICATAAMRDAECADLHKRLSLQCVCLGRLG